MTPADTKKIIAWYEEHKTVMQGYVDGKAVQYYDTNYGVWRAPAGGLPIWNYNSRYMLTPEPKLRPYTDAELHDLVGAVLKNKHADQTVVVNECSGGTVVLSDNTELDAESLLNRYNKKDGTPCGVTE